MTPVYQTIISAENGDCMRATIASLFDKQLHEVPDFLSFENWLIIMQEWIGYQGYKTGFFDTYNLDGKITLKDVLKYDGGINGYFYATVQSQTFPTETHAVIIDTNGIVVHDPNPNGLALNLKPEDIIQVMVTKQFYITGDGNKIEPL